MSGCAAELQALATTRSLTVDPGREVRIYVWQVAWERIACAHVEFGTSGRRGIVPSYSFPCLSPSAWNELEGFGKGASTGGLAERVRS